MIGEFSPEGATSNRTKTACGIWFDPHSVKEIKSKPDFGGTDYSVEELGNLIGIDLEMIDCPDCITELKKQLYHCSTHGFVTFDDVTFDEKCDYCGESV